MITELPIRTLPDEIDAGKAVPTSGLLQIQTYSQAERSKRSLKMLGLCWGVAFAAIFIPIVHFFLVPTAFIAGLLMPLWVNQTAAVIEGGRLPCPHCATPVTVAKQRFRGDEQLWPLTELCTNCRHEVRFTRV